MSHAFRIQPFSIRLAIALSLASKAMFIGIQSYANWPPKSRELSGVRFNVEVSLVDFVRIILASTKLAWCILRDDKLFMSVFSTASESYRMLKKAI